MSEPVGRPNVVAYDIDPSSAALVGVDFQRGFGHGFEPVPHADEAVANFVALARAWRAAGGTVVHVHTTYTPASNMATSAAASAARGQRARVGDELACVTATSASRVAAQRCIRAACRRGCQAACRAESRSPAALRTYLPAAGRTG